MMNGYVTSHAMRMPITSGVAPTNHVQQIALMPVACFGSRVKITVRHLFAIGWSVSLPHGCRHQYGSVPMSLPRAYLTQVRMASIHTPSADVVSVYAGTHWFGAVFYVDPLRSFVYTVRVAFLRSEVRVFGVCLPVQPVRHQLTLALKQEPDTVRWTSGSYHP